MRSFLRDNLMIVVSIALPVAVVVLFAIAQLVPRAFVEPPAFNLVLVTDYQPRQTAMRPFRVEIDAPEARLRVRTFPLESPQQLPLPRVFEYVAADDDVLEIMLDVPDDAADRPAGSEVPVPEFSGRRLITTLRAPDGYEFEQFSGGGGGLFREIFGGSRYRQGVRLRKDGAVIEIDIPAVLPYAGARFVGWVEPEP